MSDDRYGIEIDVDATDGVKAFQQLEKAEASARKESEKLSNALIRQQQVTAAASRKAATAQKAQQTQIERIGRAQLSYASAASKLGGQYGDDTRALAAKVAAQRASEAATRALTAEEAKHYQSLSNTRYALYDASQAYFGLSAALMAGGTAAIAFNTQFDKSFSSVRRTTLATGSTLSDLRSELVGLSTEMPTSFDSISQIATIGAQLGVATGDLTNFTELVSQFSATTNVSVDETAKGLGRLAQLTKTAGYEYENLGSSIYQVGITSVATEKEILDMASEIATSGNLAGFANYQIVALAGALASLGVQPEAARGSLMRIFNTIETGATEGGKKLDELASISGMTAQKFAETWGSDAQAAFTAFVNGLGKIQREGGNTNSTLKDLGISAVRDIRTLEILANNTGVYANALRESESAYASGTALQEGYAIQMQNLADKLTILGNTLKAIADSVGQAFGPTLMSAADAAKGLADILLKVVDSPIGKFLAASAVGFAMAAGAALAYQGAMMVVKASVAALTVSVQGIQSNSALLAGGLKGLAVEFYNTARAMNTTSVAARSTGTALAGTAAENYVAQRALQGTAASAGLASAAVKGLKTTLSVTVIGAALVLLPEVINEISNAFKSGAEKATDYFGTLDSLDSAIAKDTEIWKKTGEHIGLVKGELKSAATETATYSNVVGDAGVAQKTFGGSTDNATQSIKDQTIALGENSKAAYVSYLAQNKDFSEAYTKSRDELKKLGFDMGKYIEATLKGTGDIYLSQFSTKVKALLREAAPNGDDPTLTREAQGYSELIGLLDKMKNGSAALDQKSKDLANTQLFAADAGLKLANSEDQANDSTGALTGKMTEYVNSATQSVSAALSVNQAIADLSTSLAQNGNSFSTYSEAGRSNLNALKSTLDTLATSAGDNSQVFAANIIGIVETLQSNGTVISGDLNFLVDLMQQTFGNSWGIDLDTSAARADLASFIQATIVALQQRVAMERANAASALAMGNWAAYNSAMMAAKVANSQLSQVQSVQAAASKAAAQGANSLAAAHKKQASAANGANKASKGLTRTVRTMTDYVNDLKRVVSSAFDFRFGLDNAKRDLKDAQDAVRATISDFQAFADSAAFGDAIASQVVAMGSAYTAAAKEIADAAQKILDAQASLQENLADKKVVTYQLGVAIQYGDELNAAKLRAKIATLDADNVKITRELASAQNDLATAQSNGSSSAAEQMETLTKKWQDYILELVNSGASTKTVNRAMADAKANIATLGSQMGLSATGVKKYTDAINDVKKAIDKVPKKLTVSASTDPATRAIKEFLASKSLASIKSGVSMPVSAKVDNASLAKAARAQKLLAEISEAFGKATKLAISNPNEAAKWRHKGLSLQAKLIKGNYQKGGYTGSGAADEVAGIVHKGEYVVPKYLVNQSTGLPYADALGRIMRGYQGGGYVTPPARVAQKPSVSIVELSPTDRMLLAAAGNVTLSIDGKVVASTVNRANRTGNMRGNG